jgi:hypothetical protein
MGRAAISTTTGPFRSQGARLIMTENVVCYGGAKPGDNTFADIVAIDDEIFDLVAPKLVSFNDQQLAEIFRLARGMSKTARLRYLSEIACRLSHDPSDLEIKLAIEAAAAA